MNLPGFTAEKKFLDPESGTRSAAAINTDYKANARAEMKLVRDSADPRMWIATFDAFADYCWYSMWWRGGGEHSYNFSCDIIIGGGTQFFDPFRPTGLGGGTPLTVAKRSTTESSSSSVSGLTLKFPINSGPCTWSWMYECTGRHRNGGLDTSTSCFVSGSVDFDSNVQSG